MQGQLELVILIGLPASGKSTFAQRSFAASHEYVSGDRLRNNRRPGRQQGRLIAAALGAGRSVVIDNTNPSIEVRSPLICLGQAYGARIIGYYFPAEVSEALSRNRARTGQAHVPDVAIYTARKKMVAPAYGEGFDALHAARITADGSFEVRPWPESGRSNALKTADQAAPAAGGEQ